MIANDDELIVEDAHRDPLWKDNVDLKHDMSFYMGYPLRWPDGALLGTLCVCLIVPPISRHCIAESCCWNSEGISNQISLCSQRYPDANGQSSS